MISSNAAINSLASNGMIQWRGGGEWEIRRMETASVNPRISFCFLLPFAFAFGLFVVGTCALCIFGGCSVPTYAL